MAKRRCRPYEGETCEKYVGMRPVGMRLCADFCGARAGGDPGLFNRFWGSRKASGEADIDNIVDNSFARAANAQLGPFVAENKEDRTRGCE